ncbi:CmpA/NrtA family ABC transporter substrate-binding protein [Enterovirga rhinocerotis]|uniref:NitT/TauT family transport system ATP-binding protein n=1 Tax=Enterovirga rhinocerotis TaxID=1339210 RepID=A0A4R7BMJ1_9HYPH|nr:CmpA/NrtA family ABC transporter substrate-binding protein [Enterovirga rhinocerotis]TDR85505.1 NitT/TauT family transport system ATP-binding protein [Enterovirga rhinocerotis]
MIEIGIGYVPLVDAAVVIAAAERGFAERRGVAIRLEREASWATLRDKLVLGHVDAAHLLAPLAIATSIGLGPGPALPLTAPFTLSLNGNALTLSVALWEAMGRPDGSLDRVKAAFRRVGLARAAGGQPLILATVFPYSMHTYLLRRFIAGSGLDPDRDVRITVVPPSYSADALAAGSIDGFCVGAPWNSVAVAAGAGRIAAFGLDLIPDAPEKVLAWPRGRMPDRAALSLVAALREAAEWCAAPGNRPDLAALLAQPRHLALPAPMILRTLEGRLALGPGEEDRRDPAYLRIGRDIGRPEPDQAERVLSEMTKAGHLAATQATLAAAREVFDPSTFDCI